MRQADGVLSTPRLRLPATPIIPLTIAMALVESAYLAGAESREAGPLIRHEPYSHAVLALHQVGIGVCALQDACRARGMS